MVKCRSWFHLNEHLISRRKYHLALIVVSHPDLSAKSSYTTFGTPVPVNRRSTRPQR